MFAAVEIVRLAEGIMHDSQIEFLMLFLPRGVYFYKRTVTTHSYS